MKDFNKELDKALKYDALSEAENITGKSYKEDKQTEHLGFMGHILNSERKEKLLSSVDDTCFSETEQEYLRKVTDFGFKTLLIEPFINKDKIEERLYIMFHYDYSILLVWDTHTWGDDGSWAKAGETVPPPSRNDGKFYYNWACDRQLPNMHSYTSSGGCVSTEDDNKTYSCLFNSDLTPFILPNELRLKEVKWRNMEWNEYLKLDRIWNSEVKEYLSDKELFYIWSGDHDCREGLKHNISKMVNNGKFLKKWKKQPFLWLLHYMDTENDNYDYEAINKERIAKLPKDVQELIKGE